MKCLVKLTDIFMLISWFTAVFEDIDNRHVLITATELCVYL